jgi:hypothetical protein
MYQRESIWDQAVGVLTAAVGGYALESWQKADPGGAGPMIADFATLVGSAFGRRLARHPMLHEAMAALEYGAAWGAGQWVAHVTTTVGNHPAGASVPWIPGTPASGTSATDWLRTLEAAPAAPTAPATTPAALPTYSDAVVVGMEAVAGSGFGID